MDKVPNQIFKLPGIDQDQTPSYTQLYCLSSKLRAMSYFVECSLMADEGIPEDVKTVQEGAGLLLKGLAEEARQIGERVELQD